MTRLGEVRFDRLVAPLQPHLVGLQPAVQPGTFVLDELECTLGRSATCDVVVPFSWVSRLHAQVEVVGGRPHLRDFGSANGTYVNGARVDGLHRLSHHDVIGLGEAGPHLTFEDPDTTQTRTAGLQYDERTMRFSVSARPLELTPNQFRLLHHLHRSRGGVCTREQLAEAVWGAEYAPGMDATTLDRLVSTLRAAVRRADAAANVIVTRPGLGYELSDSA
jgi:DNA-binding winged helix-turn-helix (wHTH) protein